MTTPFRVKHGLLVDTLIGNENELIIASDDGELVSSGITIIDITGSVFTPLEGEGIVITPSGNDYVFSVNDYIGSTEVASISSGLDSRITTIENDYVVAVDLDNYTLLTITESISGNLQSQINAIEEEQTVLVSGEGISVIEDPTHTWTVSVTGDYLNQSDLDDYITTVEVASISSGLDSRITTNSNNIQRLDAADIESYGKTGLEYDDLPEISFNNGTRVVTISGDHNVWYRNIKYEKTTAVVPIVNEDTVTGIRFFYYDEDGILTQSLTAWSLLNEAPITYVYWNHTLQAGKIFDERHTTSFNQIQHRYQHLTLGSRLESAGEISGFTLNVNSIAAITYAVGATTFWDEDIRDVSSAILDGGPYSIWYRLGETAWTWLDTPTLPFLNNGANAWLQFNEKVGSSFQLTELTVNDSRYVNYYVIATNIINGPSTVIIPGQIAHTTLNAAQNASIADLELGALTEIFRESVALYKVINHYRHTHNTAGTGRVQIAAIENIQGQRIAQLQSVNINHNLLNNLQGGQLGEYFHLTEDDYNDRITRTEVEDEFVKINDPIEIAFPDGTGPIETAYKAFYDLDEIAIDDPITSYISDIHHGSGTSTIIGYYSEVFATSEATVYGFKSFCECDNGEAYGGYFEGISSNPSTSIYGVYGKAVFRENSYAGYFEGQVSITDDLTIQSLSVNENEILTVDENGKVTPSGIKIDINSLSVFDPYILQESDLSVDTNDDVFYIPDPEHGNLVAYDPNEIWDVTSIPDQIEIIVPTVYAEIDEVATFRLDLIVLDSQTIIIDSDFEGVDDLDLPAEGNATLLFDKPYGTDDWYVRQLI